jgi:hypothetical protein
VAATRSTDRVAEGAGRRHGEDCKRKAQEQNTPGQLTLPLREPVHEVLFDTVIVSGLEAMGPKLADFDESLHELLTAVQEACEAASHIDEQTSSLPAHRRNEAYRLRRHLALFTHRFAKRREAYAAGVLGQVRR